MHTSRILLAFLIACACVRAAQAQDTVAERQQKAIEILRKTIAEENEKKGAAGKVVTGRLTAGQIETAPASTPAMESQSGSTMAASVRGDTPDQARARAVLREAMASSSRTPAGTSMTGTLSAPAPSRQPSDSEPIEKSEVKAPAPAKADAPAAPVADVPKTKQDKLDDLLNDYIADRISPTEYHQRRAEILAE